MFSSLFVCLLATLRKNYPTDLHEIFMELGNGPMNKRLNFGGDPRHRLDTYGLFSGLVTIGRYGKWYQPTALLDAAVQSMH